VRSDPLPAGCIQQTKNLSVLQASDLLCSVGFYRFRGGQVVLQLGPASLRAVDVCAFTHPSMFSM
jgi:hypothetical protein